MNIVDLTSKKVGRLKVLYRLHNYRKKGVYWLCVCDCGNLKIVSSNNLRNGHTKSCGCLQKEPTNIIHGKSDTRLYKIYGCMKDRCNNKLHPAYFDYGERGIKICDEWLHDFQAFYDWSMSNEYDETLTIDRIDNNKGYSPDNCRWVDMKTQVRNRRNTKYITYKGETKTIKEWCEILGLNYKTVFARLHYYRWTIEKSLGLEG